MLAMASTSTAVWMFQSGQETPLEPGGPGWDRTSDLPRVKRTLSH